MKSFLCKINLYNEYYRLGKISNYDFVIDLQLPVVMNPVKHINFYRRKIKNKYFS